MSIFSESEDGSSEFQKLITVQILLFSEQELSTDKT